MSKITLWGGTPSLVAVIEDRRLASRIEIIRGMSISQSISGLEIEFSVDGDPNLWRIQFGGDWAIVFNGRSVNHEFASRWRNYQSRQVKRPTGELETVWSPQAFRESDFKDTEPSPVLEKLVERYGEGIHVIEDPELA